MEIKRVEELQPADDMSQNFIGKVEIKKMITKSESAEIEVFLVTFHNGARTKLHYHEMDQILVGTDGRGHIAIQTNVELLDLNGAKIFFKTFEMSKGDFIKIPAYSWHWHGAKNSQEFSHYQIKKPGNTIWSE